MPFLLFSVARACYYGQSSFNRREMIVYFSTRGIANFLQQSLIYIDVDLIGQARSSVFSVSEGWSPLHPKHLTDILRRIVPQKKNRVLLPKGKEAEARYVERTSYVTN